MKHNVDLTMNRDFRKEKDIKPQFLLEGSCKFIWNDILYVANSEKDFEDDLIFTGNKEDRKRKKFYAYYDYECDRCGRYLRTIPWGEITGLCNKCNKEIREQVEAVPWVYFR